jgi:hypothetical protein
MTNEQLTERIAEIFHLYGEAKGWTVARATIDREQADADLLGHGWARYCDKLMENK